MGKRIRAQRKGSSPKNEAPSHRAKGKPEYPEENAVVTDIFHAPGRNTPLMEVEEGGERKVMIPASGVSTGDEIEVDEGKIRPGNVMKLEDIPEGVPVFNIESQPGDGGKFARSGGSFAAVSSKGEDKVKVRMPSKEVKEFRPECRATVGTPAGAGRKEKPFVSAGARWHYMKSRGKAYPVTSADAMNAVDHPFGGKTTKGVQSSRSRHSPPGAKVGSISPRRTGRKER